MTTMLVAPEEEIFPNRVRWTRQTCEALASCGLLVGRYELIDGEILSKMGQKPPHAMTIMLVMQWLAPLFGILCVRIQSPLTIPGEDGETSAPEPDVAVTRMPTTAYANRHPAPEDLLLIVEVSDTTRRFDLTTKALLYARAEAQEYWAVDIVERQVHIHRAPTPTGYTEISVHAEDALVSLLAHPETAVHVSALLPPQEGVFA